MTHLDPTPMYKDFVQGFNHVFSPAEDGALVVDFDDLNQFSEKWGSFLRMDYAPHGLEGLLLLRDKIKPEYLAQRAYAACYPSYTKALWMIDFAAGKVRVQPIGIDRVKRKKV